MDAQKNSANLEDIDLPRNYATIISKSGDKLEIIDMSNFDTIIAEIDSELFKQANENDQVTYVSDGILAKVLEVRKM